MIEGKRRGCSTLRLVDTMQFSGDTGSNKLMWSRRNMSGLVNEFGA